MFKDTTGNGETQIPRCGTCRHCIDGRCLFISINYYGKYLHNRYKPSCVEPDQPCLFIGELGRWEAKNKKEEKLNPPLRGYRKGEQVMVSDRTNHLIQVAEWQKNKKFVTKVKELKNEFHQIFYGIAEFSKSAYERQCKESDEMIDAFLIDIKENE